MKSKASLLFVDDNPRVINLVNMMFRGAYQVHTASSGAAALEIIDAHPVDVIVSDERMPAMRGNELLAEVRRRSPSTIRLLVTGYSELAALVGSLNSGDVFRFVNRPWNPEELKRAVLEAVVASRAVSARGAVTGGMTSTLAANRSSGVLVIDENAEDRRAISSLIGDHFEVQSAASIPRALELLSTNEIGVVVCEVQAGGTDVGKLFRVLKEDYPTTTTVMVANPSDFDRIVGLLNGAQVFRFASKPIRESVFELAVTAAMKEHRRLCAVRRSRTLDQADRDEGIAAPSDGGVPANTRLRTA
ncbi:response regulator [Variovorax sp. Sphag1AA]|uniref:response regulator n=1 Tax=Variovorax sp. Sphag1AA TaxID=2587027 RepID=UPI0016218904|nr:response regulator [Variovorax sp. Sphag1AA]MBB3178987.1 serine/threonine-protein kinase [Variovorax sp. Sphag1AA]